MRTKARELGIRNVSFCGWVVEVGRFGRKICEGIVGNKKTHNSILFISWRPLCSLREPISLSQFLIPNS